LNYADVGEIIRDDFSGFEYGHEGQILVLGKTEKIANGSKYERFYAILCSRCVGDSELFGEGIFLATKSSLKRGQIPCGCSFAYRKTKEYYEIVCQRKADSMGYIFLGFAENFSDRKTKLCLSCPTHGEWRSGIINNFLGRGIGCPGCKRTAVGLRASKEDKEITDQFFSTGAYHPESIFERSDRVNKNGHKLYWKFTCGLCKVSAESDISSFKLGCYPCACSNRIQTAAYVNLLSDNGTPLFLKVGISKSPEARLKDQQRYSRFEVSSLFIYDFKSKEECRRAERECINSLQMGLVGESEFPDGYTETTYIHNLEKILQIFHKNNGVKRVLSNDISY